MSCYRGSILEVDEWMKGCEAIYKAINKATEEELRLIMNYLDCLTNLAKARATKLESEGGESGESHQL